MTREVEILHRSAAALAAMDAAKRAMKAAEDEVRRMCREYEQANGCRGLAPFHLAQACRARGIAA
jgi:hypothetical protein